MKIVIQSDYQNDNTKTNCQGSSKLLKVINNWKMSYFARCFVLFGLIILCVSAPADAQTDKKSGQKQRGAAGSFASAQNRSNRISTRKPKAIGNQKNDKSSGSKGSKNKSKASSFAPNSNAGQSGDWDDVKEAQELPIGIEYKKPKRGERFTFNLVDADLIELIKIIGNITGKSFILGGKVPNIKATIYAPTKITSAEAYKAFLSVLQVNGLTVVPSGRYLKIVAVAGAVSYNTPIVKGAPARDQIVTQLYRLKNVTVDDLVNLLDRFKSSAGDITVYAPTNTLIITDYGTSIKRLVKLIKLLDVPGTGEQIWVEPINFASAEELADRITEIFDIDSSATKSKTKKTNKKAKKTKPAKRASTAKKGSSDSLDEGTSISKILSDDRTNSLIIVASESAYLRILELVKILDVPIAGEGTLHVHKLQHADATELSKTLSNLSKSKGSSSKKSNSKGGSQGASLFEGEIKISADKATNALVIVSTLRDYLSLKTVIEALDSMQRQVFVEAVIMEVGLDKNKELGLGVHGGYSVDTSNGDGFWYGISQPPGGPNSIMLDPSALTGLAAGIRGPDIPGSADLVGLSIPSFGVALQALQQNSDINVLSTPHILATDNVEANITVGENVPVLQGVNSSAALLGSLAGSSGASNAMAGMMGGSLGGMMNNYSRQDVGITLKVTPHINDDNQVRLEIDLEISEVKSIDPSSGPTISKQSAMTTSVVTDQQTFVLGGLITDNQVQTTTKIPILGDIPILGVLFRHKSSLTKKRNLLIFITPYIIRSPEDFREIFERKMAERREFIERYTAFEYHRYDPHLDWSRTRGVVGEVANVVGQAQHDEELRRMTKEADADDHSPKSPVALSTKYKKKNGDVVIEPSSHPSSHPALINAPAFVMPFSNDTGPDNRGFRPTNTGGHVE